MAGKLSQPYQNAKQIPSDFWGSPVLETDDGTLFCPGFEGNTFSKNPWDFLYLGIPTSDEPKTPGICEVIVTKDRAFDSKKAVGGDGARITMHGINPSMVEVRITIWTPEQLKVMNNLWTILFPGPNKVKKVIKETVATEVPAGIAAPLQTPLLLQPTTGTTTRKRTIEQTVTPVFAVNVQHPALHHLGISSLIFTGSSGFQPGSSARTRVFTWHAVELMKPMAANQSAVHTPVAALGSALDAKPYPTPGSNPAHTGP